MIFRLLSPCSAFFCPDKKESFECDKALALVYVCLGELVSDERNYLVDSLKLWQIHLRVKTHRKIIILFLTNLLNIHCSCAFDELDYDNETMMETQTYSQVNLAVLAKNEIGKNGNITLECKRFLGYSYYIFNIIGGRTPAIFASSPFHRGEGNGHSSVIMLRAPIVKSLSLGLLLPYPCLTSRIFS